MSDTPRAAEAGEKLGASMAGAGRTAIDTAVQAADTVAGRTDEATRIATETALDVARTMTGAAERNTAAAENVADRGRQAVMAGARMAAGASLRIADASYDRGQNLITSAAQASDVYRDAAERSANRVQALFNAGMTLAQGAHQMQQAWLGMLGQTLQTASHRPADMLRCSNIVELAEVQRELYLEAVSHAFDTSSRLLEIASRTAQNAARPMQDSQN